MTHEPELQRVLPFRDHLLRELPNHRLFDNDSETRYRLILSWPKAGVNDEVFVSIYELIQAMKKEFTFDCGDENTFDVRWSFEGDHCTLTLSSNMNEGLGIVMKMTVDHLLQPYLFTLHYEKVSD